MSFDSLWGFTNKLRLQACTKWKPYGKLRDSCELHCEVFWLVQHFDTRRGTWISQPTMTLVHGNVVRHMWFDWPMRVMDWTYDVTCSLLPPSFEACIVGLCTATQMFWQRVNSWSTTLESFKLKSITPVELQNASTNKRTLQIHFSVPLTDHVQSVPLMENTAHWELGSPRGPLPHPKWQLQLVSFRWTKVTHILDSRTQVCFTERKLSLHM